MTDPLFTPLPLLGTTLPNRIVMAPLTRSRAGADGVPTALMAQYYAQRATAGLIVSEATNISPVARGFADTPGIYTDAQEAGWRLVTNAVHDAGGRIVCQLWHTGRVSHESLHPGQPPVSVSAGTDERVMAFVIDADGRGRRVPASPAVALDAAGIAGTIADYRAAAERAIAAGFDGVEVHGANGYLLHQFLASGTNRRSDEYGGFGANRAQLLLEVVDAVVAAVGAERVGVRLSPIFTGNGISDADPHATYTVVGSALSTRDLAYIHLADTGVMAPGVEPAIDELLAVMDASYDGTIILNGAYDGVRARADIAAGRADAVAFGRPFISNPDLVARLASNAPLTPADPRTFYGGGAPGYTDYPTM